MLQTGSIAFDASTLEIWGTLLNGASLYIADKMVTLDSEKIVECLDKNEITIMFLTTALFNQMGCVDFKKLTKLRCLLTGGDVISSRAVSDILKNSNGLDIMNLYGPTENTVVSTSYKITESWDPEKVLPIGKPISNSTCYVLDDNNKLLPIGALGELCVGGDGIASGYLYREELTKEKFIKNPYIDEVIYKTGDLVRWLDDGNLEFYGRIDKQVKINGFRIEIEEIERVLLKDERIQDVAIINKEVNENKKLIAFIVTKEEVDIKEIKNNLKNLLPNYMIPANIVKIDNIPLTTNGKVDNKYLSNIDIIEESNYEAARNIVELKIYNIWKEVLGQSDIDINDSFFEVGGNSILTIKVGHMIQKELGVAIPVSEIYERSTIKELAQYVYENSKENTDEEFDESIVLLKRGNKEGKNLFFIPDGTGDPASFINVVNGLSNEYTCWGIKSSEFTSYAPKVIKVEEQAKEFLGKIKKIQKEGPYNLVAFCYGSYLSTEILQEIESTTDYLNEVVFIDSIPVKLKEDKLNALYADFSEYSVEGEIKFINEELSSLKYDENSEDVEKLWSSVIELNKDISKKEMEHVKNNVHPRFIVSRNDIDTIDLKRLVKHINTIRSNENATSLYKKVYEVKELKTRLNFVKASRNELFENEFKNWKDIYSSYSNFVEVEGDHFSIMKGEGANKISNIINKVF